MRADSVDVNTNRSLFFRPSPFVCPCFYQLGHGTVSKPGAMAFQLCCIAGAQAQTQAIVPFPQIVFTRGTLPAFCSHVAMVRPLPVGVNKRKPASPSAPLIRLRTFGLKPRCMRRAKTRPGSMYKTPRLFFSWLQPSHDGSRLDASDAPPSHSGMT